jgi:hypothetical protein
MSDQPDYRDDPMYQKLVEESPETTEMVRKMREHAMRSLTPLERHAEAISKVNK